MKGDATSVVWSRIVLHPKVQVMFTLIGMLLAACGPPDEYLF